MRTREVRLLYSWATTLSYNTWWHGTGNKSRGWLVGWFFGRSAIAIGTTAVVGRSLYSWRYNRWSGGIVGLHRSGSSRRRRNSVISTCRSFAATTGKSRRRGSSSSSTLLSRKFLLCVLLRFLFCQLLLFLPLYTIFFGLFLFLLCQSSLSFLSGLFLSLLSFLLCFILFLLLLPLSLLFTFTLLLGSLLSLFFLTRLSLLQCLLCSLAFQSFIFTLLPTFLFKSSLPSLSRSLFSGLIRSFESAFFFLSLLLLPRVTYFDVCK